MVRSISPLCVTSQLPSTTGRTYRRRYMSVKYRILYSAIYIYPASRTGWREPRGHLQFACILSFIMIHGFRSARDLPSRNWKYLLMTEVDSVLTGSQNINHLWKLFQTTWQNWQGFLLEDQKLRRTLLDISVTMRSRDFPSGVLGQAFLLDISLRFPIIALKREIDEGVCTEVK